MVLEQTNDIIVLNRIISISFSTKAELELLTGVIREDYEVFMKELWEPLVAANLR